VAFRTSVTAPSNEGQTPGSSRSGLKTHSMSGNPQWVRRRYALAMGRFPDFHFWAVDRGTPATTGGSASGRRLASINVERVEGIREGRQGRADPRVIADVDEARGESRGDKTEA
jgi:hypothetical protein